MLNVSRTPVSESWLATSLPLKSHKTHKSLDTQAVVTKTGPNRFSMSTINSDLFPELLSWSAMMSEQPISPCSQHIPSDISKLEPDDLEVEKETIMEVTFSTFLVFDPTSLDFGIDASCLEGLDDLLLYSPLEAYEESCWSEVIPSPSSPSDRSPSPSPTPVLFPSGPDFNTTRHQTRSPLPTNDSSDESDSDSDSCMTYKEEDMHAAIVSATLVKLEKQQYTLGTYNDEKRPLYYEDDDTTSFILLEPSLPAPKTQDCVSFFPIPTARPHRPSMPSRLVAFCAKLPSSLTSVRPP